MTRLKVAVRVRPLSESETLVGSKSIVDVENADTITITNIKVPEQNAGDSRERTRRFTFDYCFHQNSTQDHVFDAVESVIGKAIKSRFHSCVLAYGQSSSGKTHTMMGFPHDPGLTPKLCQRIFGYLQESAVGDEITNMKISVSYLEIYNEKVRDLLSEEDCAKLASLKVREHPRNGPYVQGLTEHAVCDSETLIKWLEVGNSKRRVAATSSNSKSSRSHAVFTVSCGGAKLHLVDLAGSERAGSRCYNSLRFREGANINKSLVALGNVISALAEQTHKQSKNNRRRFIPYRDSVLTWLLKDTLGGNSNTFMIATISPSSACYSETVNTLRFGQRAKLIVSRPVVIEDPKESIIRELRAEIARLRELLKLGETTFVSQPLSNPMCDPSIPFENEIKNDTETTLNRIDLPQETEDSDLQIDKRNVEDNTHNLIKSEVTKKNSSVIIEKLLPLMSVSSTIQKNQTKKLRRTFSVDHNISTMDKDKQKLFGSHDDIPLSKITNTKPKQQVVSPPNSSSSSSRRSSLNKPLKPIPQRKTLDTGLTKVEKGVVTEVKGTIKAEAKVDSIRRQPIKPRHQIVAAVTNRLYSKIKKKEVGTDTDDINLLKPDLPKELSICSNARMKLRELTQRALKAHKSRHEETQTDLAPIIRVKEISTDVQDLRIELLEVKDSETMSDIFQTKDVAINCNLPQDFECGIKITRSCGTQFGDENSSSSNVDNQPKECPTNPISFTKYLRELQDHKYKITNVGANNPIYTSSVNINISHNYINGNRVENDNESDDSLDERTNTNVCFPTPDLISNHNSLEQHTHSPANTTILPEEHLESIQSMSDDNKPTYCVANCEIVSKCTEKLHLINLPTVCAPETCVIQNELKDQCNPFTRLKPETAKAKVIEKTNYFKCDDCITVQEPLILKSIMKLNADQKDESVSCDECPPNTDIPDSLEYHIANKQVRFKKKKSQPENERMIKAMSSFLEEATLLMTNLTMAASKFDGNSSLFTDNDLEFQVTINDLHDIHQTRKKRKRKRSETKSEETEIQTNSIPVVENYSQTLPQTSRDDSTQYEYSVPVNKYEAVLEEACKRLEEKIQQMPKGTTRHRNYDNSDLLFSTTTTYNPWENDGGMNETEDSSIDSNPKTYSDYGSLPRRTYKRHRTPTCSPSAFLKQLTTMRKQIIESSREELLKNNSGLT